MRKFALIAIVSVAILLVGAVACGDDDDDDGGDDGGGASEVDITLQEFSIVPDPTSADAGSVTFNIENVGPEDPHEFVIIKTDLAADGLPTGDDGSVDEEGEGIEVIDEVEDLEVGASETLTVDLEAGSYALICNIVEEEDGELESHYQEGMRVGFTVN